MLRQREPRDPDMAVGIKAAFYVVMGLTLAISLAIIVVAPRWSIPHFGDPMTQQTATTPVTNAEMAYTYLQQKPDFNPIIAAAIVGNLKVESDVNPAAKAAGGSGYGVAMWANTAPLLAYAKLHNASPANLTVQLDYLADGLRSNSPLFDQLLLAADVKAAAVLFAEGYLHIPPNTASLQRRAQSASDSLL